MTNIAQLGLGFPDGDECHRLGVAGAYRRTDPETSREAAQSIDAASLEGRVYQYLLDHGPSILDEMVRGMKVDKVTVSPRLAPLVEAGYVVRTGIKRPGHAGRSQTEWKAVPGKGKSCVSTA